MLRQFVIVSKVLDFKMCPRFTFSQAKNPVAQKNAQTQTEPPKTE